VRVLIPLQLKKSEMVTPCAVNQRGFAGAVAPYERDDVISSERFSLSEKHAVCNGSTKKC